MDYRKLIKEEIAKLHTAKGVKVNPKLDSDLGEQIVADICRKVVKNCSIPAVVGRKLKDNSNDRKWVCQKCGELVDGRNVTFEEYHEGCGGRCV